MDDITQQPQTGLPTQPIVEPIVPTSAIPDSMIIPPVPEVTSEPVPEVPNAESNAQEATTQPLENQPQNEELSTIDAQLPTDNLVEIPQDISCIYCQNKEKYQNLIDTYIERSAAKIGDKVSIPFIEELVLLLKVSLAEFSRWMDDVTHIDLITSYERLMLIQRLRLLQRASGRFQPDGAIYLLSKLHNL